MKAARANIPLIRIDVDYPAMRRQLIAAATRVLDSGHFILGPEVARFEQEFARLIRVPRCLGLATGTDALQIALEAAGVGPGDEVILPAMTFIATATAVSALGAKPVFADIDPYANTLDTEQAARKITRRTKAIIPVHLYGHPADMDPLLALAKTRKLRIIEDCAQAVLARYRGRPVGGIGDIGCFSFYPTKNLAAAGDAGAVTTRSAALFEACKVLRNAGRAPGKNYEHAKVANNSRLDELQAAILRVKMRRLSLWTEKRRNVAALYRDALSGLPLQLPPEGDRGIRPVYHLFIIRTPRRDALARHLGEAGIATGVYYPIPLHLQPAYAFLGHRKGDFPVAERAARECLALPMHPGLSSADVDRVASSIRKFYAR